MNENCDSIYYMAVEEDFDCEMGKTIESGFIGKLEGKEGDAFSVESFMLSRSKEKAIELWDYSLSFVKKIDRRKPKLVEVEPLGAVTEIKGNFFSSKIRIVGVVSNEEMDSAMKITESDERKLLSSLECIIGGDMSETFIPVSLKGKCNIYSVGAKNFTLSEWHDRLFLVKQDGRKERFDPTYFVVGDDEGEDKLITAVGKVIFKDDNIFSASLKTERTFLLSKIENGRCVQNVLSDKTLALGEWAASINFGKRMFKTRKTERTTDGKSSKITYDVYSLQYGKTTKILENAEKADLFSDPELLLFSKNGKGGLMDCEGNIVKGGDMEDGMFDNSRKLFPDSGGKNCCGTFVLSKNGKEALFDIGFRKRTSAWIDGMLFAAASPSEGMILYKSKDGTETLISLDGKPLSETTFEEICAHKLLESGTEIERNGKKIKIPREGFKILLGTKFLEKDGDSPIELFEVITDGTETLYEGKVVENNSCVNCG